MSDATSVPGQPSMPGAPTPPPPPPPASAAPPPPPPPQSSPPPPSVAAARGAAPEITSVPPAPAAAAPQATASAARAPLTAADDDLAELLAQIQDEDQLDAAIAAPGVGAALTKPTDVDRPERVAAAVVESDGGIDFDPEPAGFAARAIGLGVDLAILVLWTLPGWALVATGTTALLLLGLALVVAGFAASTWFYARAISTRAASPGNRVANTKVVDARNGRLVDSGEASLRYVLRFLVSIIFFIGFFVALGNAQRRTFHDTAAGTIVTRPPRASWSIDDEDTAPPSA